MIIVETPKLLKLFKSKGQAHLGFIILLKDRTDLITLNHERIHIAQQIELAILFWYLFYLIDFLINWLLYGKFWNAYNEVLFEKEAYKYETDFNYLEDRRNYKWFEFDI